MAETGMGVLPVMKWTYLLRRYRGISDLPISESESEILLDNINHHHTPPPPQKKKKKKKKNISFTVKYLYSIQYTWLSTEQFIIMPCSSNSNSDVVRGPHWGWIAAIMLTPNNTASR